MKMNWTQNPRRRRKIATYFNMYLVIKNDLVRALKIFKSLIRTQLFLGFKYNRSVLQLVECRICCLGNVVTLQFSWCSNTFHFHYIIMIHIKLNLIFGKGKYILNSLVPGIKRYNSAQNCCLNIELI